MRASRRQRCTGRRLAQSVGQIAMQAFKGRWPQQPAGADTAFCQLDHAQTDLLNGAAHQVCIKEFDNHQIAATDRLEYAQQIQALRAVVQTLGACRTWGVDSEKRPQRGQFLPDLQAHSPGMGQKAGVLGERRSQKWTAEAVSQPTFPKSDRLLATPALRQRRHAQPSLVQPAHRVGWIGVGPLMG